jgi:uncharacterized protein YjiS (DUF1127 family)
MNIQQIPAHKIFFIINIKENYSNLRTVLSEWHRRHKTRIQLADLDDRALQDIGISRYDARIEADKPFWEK